MRTAQKDKFVTRQDGLDAVRGLRNGLLIAGPIWVLIVMAWIKWSPVVMRYMGWM